MKTKKPAAQAGAKDKAAEDKAQEKKSEQVKDEEKTENYEELYNEFKDKYLRLYSEFDNFRKRTLKEKLELSKTASEEIILELLPVIDDFERALNSSKELKECTPVVEGMQLIYNKLTGILTKKGLKAIEAKGNEFDTDFHEAVTFIPAPSEELKGKVVDEIEKGYLLHDKVIRYTKVVIGQ